ncbi:MAG: hypothetical protein KC419_11270 [Anaerolineales bacterium]|nr:hypothetical protein [Anaerolineales bacterium]MCA9929054.1 hypothetical protein [Anaerolineales bacterium]
MEMTFPEQNQLKQVLKEALSEALREERDFFHDLVAEVLEDMALSAAIREGQESEFVSRDDVMAVLTEDA